MTPHILLILTSGALVFRLAATTFVCPTLFDFYPDTEDCTKFYRCFWGAAYPFHCPSGTKWHHKLLTCDFSHNVDCDSSATWEEPTAADDKTNSVQTEEEQYEYDYKDDYKVERDGEEHYDETTDAEEHYDYDYENSDESWHTANYDMYETESGKKNDGQNSPTHGRKPIEKGQTPDTATPPSTPPNSLHEAPSTDKSLIDYLYPEYITDDQGEQSGQTIDKERSDVTHDYAWYEGRDYDYDYSRPDHHYQDYQGEYEIKNKPPGYPITPDDMLDPDSSIYDEISYFQNGYPGYRHHYQPEDYLSPSYARHNGPIGRRR